MDWIEALVLGVIQGLTEFLPVSSTGHLQIFSALFGIQCEENLAFAAWCMRLRFAVRLWYCGKRLPHCSADCLNSAGTKRRYMLQKLPFR